MRVSCTSGCRHSLVHLNGRLDAATNCVLDDVREYVCDGLSDNLVDACLHIFLWVGLDQLGDGGIGTGNVQIGVFECGTFVILATITNTCVVRVGNWTAAALSEVVAFLLLRLLALEGVSFKVSLATIVEIVSSGSGGMSIIIGVSVAASVHIGVQAHSWDVNIWATALMIASRLAIGHCSTYFLLLSIIIRTYHH